MHMRNLRKADQTWRTAKQGAITRARALVAQELAGYLKLRDQEVRAAFEAGIPKRQIGIEGLGSSSSTTVEEALQRTATAATLAASGAVS